MTNKEKNLLLALSLGDGFLSKDGNAGKLYLCHGEYQLTYLQHKVNLVSSILYKNFNVYKTESKFGTTWRSSMYHRYFGILRNFLYKDGKKFISKKVLDRIDEQGLAYWYMDDGSCYAKKRNGRIHSYELVLCLYATKEECQTVINWLLEKFEISAGLKLNKGKYSVRMGTHQAKKFIETVRPFILKEFEYKLITSHYENGN